MKRKIVIGVFIFTIAVTIRFFCGVYRHDEFAEKYFFIKHRPTWKWIFYSPIGMSDRRIEEFSKEEQTEQKYYNEFIEDQGLSN